MRSSEFMNYISTPIKYEKCELFHDFIKSINKIIYKTYLGEEYISNEKEMVQHFNWCVDKVLSDFGEENIIFQDTTQIKEYFYFFYEELFYKRNEDVNKLDKLDKLANLSFNYHRLKSRSDIDVLIELYKLLDKSLTKKIKK